MSEQNAPANHAGASPSAAQKTAESSSHETRPAESELPTEEKYQPDPMLQMTTGRIGAGGIALVGVVVALIVAMAIYGFNSRVTPQHAAATPPAAQTAKPAAGGQGGPPQTGAPRANESGNKG